MKRKYYKCLLSLGFLMVILGCSNVTSTNTKHIATTSIVTSSTDITTNSSTNETTTKKSVQINYYLFDGEDIISIISEEGETISLLQPNRTGYTFLGWQLEENFDQEGFYSIETPSYDLNLYAKWEIKQFNVRVYDNDNILIETYLVDYDQIITDIDFSDFFIEGYIFVGLYLDEDREQPLNNQRMPDYDINIYANFITNFQYLFSYFSENGTFYSNELIDGYTITIPDTENTYKFSVEADGTIYLSCIYENETGGYIFELSYKYEEFSPFAIVLSISAYTLNVYGTDDDATYDFETAEFIYEYDFNTWGVIIPEESIIEVTESSFNQLLLFSISYFETIIGVPFQ